MRLEPPVVVSIYASAELFSFSRFFISCTISSLACSEFGFICVYELFMKPPTAAKLLAFLPPWLLLRLCCPPLPG